MKVWKLVSGIISLVLVLVIIFQSCAVGISNAMSKHSLKQNIICYRGDDANPMDNMEVGTKFRFKQFLSTSVIESGALNKTYKSVIIIPKGTKGAYIADLSRFKRQYEFLLDYDCEYIYKGNDGNTIYLEVL